MRPRSLFVCVLLLGGLVAAWTLVPEGERADAGAARARDAEVVRRRSEATPDESLAARRPPTPAEGRADALQASEEAILDGVHDQLDALDAEVGLDEAQFERLEAVLTEERTRGLTTIAALRQGHVPGRPPPDMAAIASSMEGLRAKADADARAVLDDEAYAAWTRSRSPRARE